LTSIVSIKKRRENMSNSAKKMRKNTTEIPKYTFEKNHTDLNNQIAKANEIIGLFDKLLINSARKKVGASEYNNLLSELLFRATTCSNMLQQCARDTIRNRNHEETDEIISVLGKLSAKTTYYPKTYEEACELGCVIILKDKIRLTIATCKLEDSIKNLCAKYRINGLSEEDIKNKILSTLDQYDIELLKVYSSISPSNQALNKRRSEIDEKIGCTDQKTREDIKDDIKKSLNSNLSSYSIVALRTALSALNEVETEDQEFYYLLNELRSTLEQNEKAREEVEKYLITDVPRATGIVLHTGSENTPLQQVSMNTTLQEASINRNEPSPVTSFKNDKELGKLRNIRGNFYNNMVNGGLFTVSGAILASTLGQSLPLTEFAIGLGALEGCVAASIIYFMNAYENYKNYKKNGGKQL